VRKCKFGGGKSVGGEGKSIGRPLRNGGGEGKKQVGRIKPLAATIISGKLPGSFIPAGGGKFETFVGEEEQCRCSRESEKRMEIGERETTRGERGRSIREDCGGH